jgi:polyribonucleotide nucleotidyltransferase
VESTGRLRLSHKAVLMQQAGKTIDLADFAKTGGGRRPGGDRGRGDDRGRRDDRGGRRDGGGRGGDRR